MLMEADDFGLTLETRFRCDGTGGMEAQLWRNDTDQMPVYWWSVTGKDDKTIAAEADLIARAHRPAFTQV